MMALSVVSMRREPGALHTPLAVSCSSSIPYVDSSALLSDLVGVGA